MRDIQRSGLNHSQMTWDGGMVLPVYRCVRPAGVTAELPLAAIAEEQSFVGQLQVGETVSAIDTALEPSTGKQRICIELDDTSSGAALKPRTCAPVAPAARQCAPVEFMHCPCCQPPDPALIFFCVDRQGLGVD
jgi:hypothetical protein